MGDLKYVRVEGAGYLGTLEQAEGQAVLANACKWATDKRATAQRWVRKSALGELQAITLMGAQAYTVEDLTPETQLMVDEEIARMDLAKDRVEAKMAVAIYDGNM